MCCGDRTEGRGRRTGLEFRCGSQGRLPGRHHLSKELQEANKLILQAGNRAIQAEEEATARGLHGRKAGTGLQRYSRLGARDGIRDGHYAWGKGVRAGAWRGPRDCGFYFEGHRQSTGRALSSFQRVTPMCSTDCTGGRGHRRGHGLHQGGEKQSDAKYIVKVKPVRFSDK